MNKLPASRLAIALTVTLGILFGPLSSIVQADDSSEIAVFTPPGNAGYIGVSFDEGEDSAGTSLLTAVSFKDDKTPIDDWRETICDSAQDPKCLLADRNFRAVAIFSPCTEVIVVNCIESLIATKADGSKVMGKVTRMWNMDTGYKGDPARGIPDGGRATSWELPGTNPGGSETYIVVAGTGGWASTLGGPKDKASMGQLFAKIQPVKEVTGNYESPKMQIVKRGQTGESIGGGLTTLRGCVMNETGSCAIRSAFPLDVTYALKMRFGQPVSPWLRGRMIDPSVTTEDLAGGNSAITISGKAMLTPEVGGYIKWSEAPSDFSKLYPAGTGGIGTSPNAFTTQDLANRVLRTQPGSSGVEALKEFQRWIPLLQDRPNAMKSYWGLKALKDQPTGIMETCAKNSFAGLVTTNAAVYSDGAPTWNQNEQSLNYTVGAPHFDTEGKVISGIYNLALRSDVARCLYKFSSAPVSANIEVSSDDGTPNIATTILNERNGWVNLIAAGFHYSVPKVKVTLTQEGSENKVVTTNPKATAIVKSISCVKGKLKKTVRGTSPKCPTGYKKA